MRILLDTGILIALMLPSETHHKTVSKKIAKLQDSGALFFVTDYVVDEFLTRMLYDAGHQVAKKAQATLQELIEDHSLVLHYVYLDMFQKSMNLFPDLSKKGLSFTDVTTWVAYSESKFDDLLTLDSDFRKVGLKTVLF